VGLAAIQAPRVGGIEPLIVGLALEVTGFDAPTAEGEFLPDPRADRKHPGVRVGAVDGGARRQRDPPALGGAIGPKRVLRRKRQVLRVDLERREVRVKPGVLQHLRRLHRGRLRNGLHALEKRKGEDQRRSDPRQPRAPAGSETLRHGHDIPHRISSLEIRRRIAS
jgi:hypothetical protein